MTTFDIPGSKTVLARCVAAEFRARMAARRLSGKSLALESGMSQNYLATRLRDEKPFTLDDVERLTDALDEHTDPATFILEAYERHGNQIGDSLMGIERDNDLSQPDVALAAREDDDDEEAAAQANEA